MDEGVREATKHGALAPLFVVSGATGSSAEQLVHTALAQFPDVHLPIVVIPRVQTVAEIERCVDQAAAAQGTIVHTLVVTSLRQALIRLAKAHGVVSIDLIGHLLGHLTTVLGKEPIGQPGLYRQLHQDYFERIAAIEFTVAHDDGQRAEDWPQADLLLSGVSRVGKTPLSMYLAVQGWRVANYPIVPGVALPDAIDTVDSSRIIGLTIAPEVLALHRRSRQRRLHLPATVDYVQPESLSAEIRAAERLFRQRGITIIDVSETPLEESASQIISLIGPLPDRR